MFDSFSHPTWFASDLAALLLNRVKPDKQMSPLKVDNKWATESLIVKTLPRFISIFESLTNSLAALDVIDVYPWVSGRWPDSISDRAKTFADKIFLIFDSVC